ncbi:hypothetical protein PPYR_10393 [Photinus pyralis]|uniref:Uncharacterized protein n=1 Tax=Photinus pyralis TaxID=7054 RepID=A0A1Y1MZW0_PHOPY|nr:uncharacterized protein LOC116173052 [Photinus pyralis]KAB0796332.1 hypothetical protein PPYR_10393 [Photinus pyralis]
MCQVYSSLLVFSLLGVLAQPVLTQFYGYGQGYPNMMDLLYNPDLYNNYYRPYFGYPQPSPMNYYRPQIQTVQRPVPIPKPPNSPSANVIGIPNAEEYDKKPTVKDSTCTCNN